MSAIVTFDTPSIDPHEMWIEVPSEFESWLKIDSGAFHIAGLPIAMRLGEPVEWSAPADRSFRRNIDEFQRVFACWYPETLRYIPTEFTATREATNRPDRIAGCFFSAGIDAMHTAFRVRHEDNYLDNPGAAALVSIQGLDLYAAEVVSEVERAARAVAAPWGWSVIPARTNLKEFLTKKHGLDWVHHTHGLALISVGFALSGGLNAVHIGSTTRYDCLPPEGSTPRTDELWRTKDFQVLHVGADCSRIQKIEEMAEWDVWKDYFRVCFSEQNKLNCGACPKCVRTMYCLDVLGLLEQTSGRFMDGTTESLDEKVGKLWTWNQSFKDLLKELADRYREKGNVGRAKRIERLLRHLSPSPMRQVLRSLDSRYLGGCLNSIHSFLKRR